MAKTKVSKKLIKEIDHCSVYDDVLREYGNNFQDSRPEEWGKFDRELFDIATEIERRLKMSILKVLGVAEDSEGEAQAASSPSKGTQRRAFPPRPKSARSPIAGNR